ncbi:hypothetical protein A2U01_0037421, partial [Trifolium medium]|nr:hypothetical protein [Trifolium medium]
SRCICGFRHRCWVLVKRRIGGERDLEGLGFGEDGNVMELLKSGGSDGGGDEGNV